MYSEMKLMDLARRVYEASDDEVIDFTNGDTVDAEFCGGWMGIKKINAFDNDNVILLIGLYGGEANTRLYAISEYDDRIGDFCSCYMGRYEKYVGWIRPSDNDYVVCIAKAVADFLIDYWGCVSETITVDEEV